jgi:hypothetical protein
MPMTSIMRHNHKTALDRFAAANGWKTTDAIFSFDTLISEKKHDGGRTWSHPLHCGHPEYFKVNGYPVAIMAHNYPGEDDNLRRDIDELDGDLWLQTPECGRVASWYYPFHTLPMCVTRPGVSIIWPTDHEMALTAEAYFIERAAERERDAVRARRRTA